MTQPDTTKKRRGGRGRAAATTSLIGVMREITEETGIHGEVFAALGSIDLWFRAEGHLVHKTVQHYLQLARRSSQRAPARVPGDRDQRSQQFAGQLLDAGNCLRRRRLPQREIVVRSAQVRTLRGLCALLRERAKPSLWR